MLDALGNATGLQGLCEGEQREEGLQQHLRTPDSQRAGRRLSTGGWNSRMQPSRDYVLGSRAFLTLSNLMVLNTACAMETTREHVQTQMPGLCPTARDSEPSAVGLGADGYPSVG